MAHEDLKIKVAILEKTVPNGGPSARGAQKVKVLEPKYFNGEWDAKEVENFLWTLEWFLKSLQIKDEVEKVNSAYLYLFEDHCYGGGADVSR